MPGLTLDHIDANPAIGMMDFKVLEYYDFTPEQQKSIVEMYPHLAKAALQTLEGKTGDAALKHTQNILKLRDHPTHEQMIEGLNSIFQQHLRPAGAERQQTIDLSSAEEKAALAHHLTAWTAAVESGKPAKIKLLLGASESESRVRAETLIEFIKKGDQTTDLYPLGSTRALWPIHEPITTTLVAEKAHLTPEYVQKDFYNSFKELVFIHQNFINSKDLITLDKLESITNPEFQAARKAAISSLKAPSIDQQIATSLQELQKYFAKATEATRKQVVAEYESEYHIQFPSEASMLDRIIGIDYSAQLTGISIHPALVTPPKTGAARADTLDTLEHWVQENKASLLKQYAGQKPTIAIISSPPFAEYQRQQALLVFAKHPELNFVGAISREIKAEQGNLHAVVKDTIARALYAGKDLAISKSRICGKWTAKIEEQASSASSGICPG